MSRRFRLLRLRLWWASGLLVAGGLIGCSLSDEAFQQVPVTPAKGKVTYQGKPVANAMLYFVPVSDKPDAIRPRAQTDEKGEYQLNVYAGKYGAPEGDYVVTITWPGPKNPPKLTPGEEDNGLGLDFLRGRFRDPKTSPFKISIRADAPVLPTIEIPTR